MKIGDKINEAVLAPLLLRIYTLVMIAIIASFAVMLSYAD